MTVRTNRFNKAHIPLHIIFIALCAIFILPILYIVSISFTSDNEIAQYGYLLIPHKVSFLAYNYLFRTPTQLLRSYSVSGFVTVAGTLVSLFLTTMLAYTLARQDYRFRKAVSFIVFFTMLFNGGLVPTYILITKYLNLKNNIMVLILPYLVNAWFVLLMRSYISTLPLSLVESAKIDGAGEFRTFIVIILPLAQPALAAVGMMIAFNYWNDWWLSLLYIDVDKLIPLQYLLYRTMNNIMYLTQQLSSSVSVSIKDIPTESARMAMCILAAGPMLIIFPFFQKYFVRGITVGAIKG
jgi:putative aldouronate transport system permease protein